MSKEPQSLRGDRRTQADDGRAADVGTELLADVVPAKPTGPAFGRPDDRLRARRRKDERYSTNVVPANAGTHTPCLLDFGAVAAAICNNQSRGVWVPAFPLAHQAHRAHPTIPPTITSIV